MRIINIGYRDTNRKIRTAFSIEYCCISLVPNGVPVQRQYSKKAVSNLAVGSWQRVHWQSVI